MNKKTEDYLLNAGRKILEEPADSELVDKLAQARRQALDEIPGEKAATKIKLFVTGAVFATVLAILVYVIPLNHNRSPAYDEISNQLVSDFELLLESEDLALLEEDIDFLIWLEEQEEAES